MGKSINAPYRVNFMLDAESYESSRVKRPFSTSALIRFWMKILVHDQKVLNKMYKEDEEFKAILDYVEPKIKRIFG